jgi:hypothetical protein
MTLPKTTLRRVLRFRVVVGACLPVSFEESRERHMLPVVVKKNQGGDDDRRAVDLDHIID